MADKKIREPVVQQSFELGPNPLPNNAFHHTYQTQIFSTSDSNLPGIAKGFKSADLIPFYIQDKRKLSYSGAVTAAEAACTRLIQVDGRSATLTQRAANITSNVGRNKGKVIFRHLGEREQTVIDALKYIASKSPTNFGEYQGSACLKFTLGQIINVIEGSYNKNEIAEALDVLHGSDTELRVQTNDRSTKPIKSALLPILITQESGVNPDLFDDHSTFLCTFHPIISKDIASLNFRQINYDRIKKRRSSLAKYIEKRLSYNYTQASHTYPYGPVLASSLLLGDGIAYDPERDADSNFRPLSRAFSELVMPDSINLLDLTDAELDNYIIEKLEVTPVYEETLVRRRRIIDYKYTIYPTERFIQQQIEANIAANKDVERLRLARELQVQPKDVRQIKIEQF